MSTIRRGINASHLFEGMVDPARLGTGSGGTTKYLREDNTWQTIAGGGDALTSENLDQFDGVTQTAGQSLTITSSTTLSGGTHSGTNTGDQNLSSYATTDAIAAAYQPLSTNLTSIGAVANASGVLTNNGSGGFSYTTPGGGGTTNFTAAVGFPAVLRKQVNVTAAACLPESEVTVSWRNVLATDENDPEMDDIRFRAIPGTGSFDLILSAPFKAKFGGDFKLKYSLS